MSLFLPWQSYLCLHKLFYISGETSSFFIWRYVQGTKSLTALSTEEGIIVLLCPTIFAVSHIPLFFAMISWSYLLGTSC